MSSRVICACLVLALVGIMSFGRSAAQPSPPPEQQPPTTAPAEGVVANPFAGKVVFFRARSEPKGTLLLEQPAIHRFGDQAFLTGVPADMGDNAWSKGARHWVPLDNIAVLMEFDSKDDYVRRARAAQTRPAGRPRPAAPAPAPAPAPNSNPRDPGDL